MQIKKLISVLCPLLAALLTAGCTVKNGEASRLFSETAAQSPAVSVSDSSADALSDVPYIPVNNNYPDFSEAEKSSETAESSQAPRAYAEYSELDMLGRCGRATAVCGKELMPKEKRGDIGMIKPTGWHTVKYDCVDGKYLYNRCHLIGWQLTGENANQQNLITGTRYMNVEGMLPFENMVADYIKETDNHVLYRVTPDFKDEEMLARGVLLEGYSLEDNGEGICFSVYVHNIQPGIIIDYATGESREESPTNESNEKTDSSESSEAQSEQLYILNTSAKRFHRPDCRSVKNIKQENKTEKNCFREQLIAEGYLPCGNCKP